MQIVCRRLLSECRIQSRHFGSYSCNSAILHSATNEDSVRIFQKLVSTCSLQTLSYTRLTLPYNEIITYVG